MYEDDLAKLEERIRTGLRRRQPRVLRWYRPDATGLERWIRSALDDPRDFAYRTPRRIACRLLGWHNPTCIGRPNHPRRW